MEDEKTTPEKMPKKMKRLRKLDSKGEAPPEEPVKKKNPKDVAETDPPKKDRKKKEQDEQQEMESTPEGPVMFWKIHPRRIARRRSKIRRRSSQPLRSP